MRLGADHQVVPPTVACSRYRFVKGTPDIPAYCIFSALRQVGQTSGTVRPVEEAIEGRLVGRDHVDREAARIAAGVGEPDDFSRMDPVAEGPDPVQPLRTWVPLQHGVPVVLEVPAFATTAPDRSDVQLPAPLTVCRIVEHRKRLWPITRSREASDEPSIVTGWRQRQSIVVSRSKVTRSPKVAKGRV